MDSVLGIIAVLAFLISLAAIWMAADVVKRTDTSNRSFYEANIKALKETVLDQKAAIDGLSRHVSELERDAATARATAERAEARAAAMEGALRSLADGLARLDRSIPQRYRSAVRPAGPEVPKPDDQANLQ